MTRKKTPDRDDGTGEVLVAIINNYRDFEILRGEGWYRIPVTKAPRRWPPQWLAFYQTKVFGDDAYAVRYFGQVSAIRQVPRKVLFPNELTSSKSERLYYQIQLRNLETLSVPIVSRRWRRIVFIPTTWSKFVRAGEINDLYDESPLEDLLWLEFQRLAIPAERQWLVEVARRYYRLDFALFCNEGMIDVETDGDSYHIGVEPGARDRRRINDLTTVGWHTLRFNGSELREQMAEYCIPEITASVNRFGGLKVEGQIVPTSFCTVAGETVHQLSLFEPTPEYEGSA